MPMTAEMRVAIGEGYSTEELKALAVRGGMQTLRMAGLQKFSQGLTTLSEVVRVSAPD